MTKTRSFLLAASIALALAFTLSCSSDDGGGGELDGTWNFYSGSTRVSTLIISGNNYTLKVLGENWGKGNISYGNSAFTFTSTHAWRNTYWEPFVETIKGNYSLRGTTMTISNLPGRYSDLNGVWTK